MNQSYEELARLRQQCARRKKLLAAREELEHQVELYTGQVQQLRQELEKEQQDVERLEEGGLTAFFYNVLGKMDEKRIKEEGEAYAARMKYQSALRQLEGAQADLEACCRELDSLEGCQGEYAALLQEKTAAIKAAGGARAEQLLRLEEQRDQAKNQQRELLEAIGAGQDALACTNRILDSLGSAQGWGTWDLVGGSFVTDLIKHGHLDEAQGEMEQLQSLLRRFKTELADVTIQADFQVNVDGFLRIADYLFDGIFVDWAVLDRIEQSQRQVEEVARQVTVVLDYLDTRVEEVTGRIRDLEREMETYVETTTL